MRGIFLFAITLALLVIFLLISFKSLAYMQILIAVLFAIPLLMFAADTKGNEKSREELFQIDDNSFECTIFLYKLYFSRYFAFYELVYKKIKKLRYSYIIIK
jgi:hypothetical protein